MRSRNSLHKPSVLHRYRRLCGETFDQCDLPFGEGAHFIAIQNEGAEKRGVVAQCDPQRGADAAELDHLVPSSDVAGWRQVEISNIDDLNQPLTLPMRASALVGSGITTRVASRNAAGKPRIAAAWNASPS